MLPLEHLAGRLADFRLRRARSAVAVIVALLCGCGAVAFAVAPLTGDEAPLPAQRLVIEELKSNPLAEQINALAAQEIELLRDGVTRRGDDVASVLRRLGLQDLSAAAVLAHNETLRALLDGSAERIVQLRSSRSGDFIDLVVRGPADSAEASRSHFSRLTVSHKDGAWQTRQESVPYGSEPRRAAGVIRSTLKAAALDIGLPLPVATQLAEFAALEGEGARELVKGDVFSVVYQALLADGEPVPWSEGAWRVLAAEFSGPGLAQQMIWFEDQAGMGGWFDRKGRRLALGGLAAPVEFARITSGFELRMDPILRRTMEHRGVDYSAPLGTPVHSVAPGVVEFAGRQSGYGNVVEVRHSAERTTLYAHLSRIDVEAGDRVAQGAVLGAVGRTGWATGPHLHFEYRLGGVHQDPQLATKSLEAAALAPAVQRQFDQRARSVKLELDAARVVGLLRRNSFE